MVYATVIVSLTIILVVWLLYRPSRPLPRADALRAMAQAEDLSYSEKDNTILERLKFFKIYDATTLQVAAHNVLRVKTPPPDIWIFDYRAVVGLRHATKKIEQTVFYASDPRVQLPGFRILPRHSEVGRESEAVFKYRPIIFQSHPQFMALYRLVGPDEQELRELFTSDLIACFEKNKGLCVEGFGHEVIIYRHKTVIAAQTISSFYRTARSLVQLLFHYGMNRNAQNSGPVVDS